MMGVLSIRGHCWRGVVEVIELGYDASTTVEEWNKAISRVGVGRLVVFINESRSQEGVVAGSWHRDSIGERGVSVSQCATVWNREIAGMRLALESVPEGGVLVPSDSRAAIRAVVEAARLDVGRTGHLVRMVDLIGERE